MFAKGASAITHELGKARITDHGLYMEVLFRDRELIGDVMGIGVSTGFPKPVKFVTIKNSPTSYRIEWWTRGKCHNPFGGPSVYVQSLTNLNEYYTQPNGTYGRDNGPCIIEHQYGVSYREEWANKHGKLHRVGGSCYTNIRYEKANTEFGEYLKHVGHDPEFIMYMPPITKIDILRDQTFEWKQNGQFVDSDDHWSQQSDHNVAESIQVTPDLDIIKTSIVGSRELRWYNSNGELNRLNGPAVIKFTNVKEVSKNDKSMPWQFSAWRTEWFINGKFIPFLRINDWVKRNGFRINNHPCHDRRAFTTDEAEVCFLADFVGGHPN